MKQLDLFPETLNCANDFDDTHHPKIYESPDKGKTVYVRDFGSNPATRTLNNPDSQEHWTITFGSPNGA